MVNYFHSIYLYYIATFRKLQVQRFLKLRRSSFLTARFCQLRQSALSQRQTAADTRAERRRQSAKRRCSIFQAARISELTRFGLGMWPCVKYFYSKKFEDRLQENKRFNWSTMAAPFSRQIWSKLMQDHSTGILLHLKTKMKSFSW